MFDRIRKVLSGSAPGLRRGPGADHASPSLEPVSQWASTQGMAFTQGSGPGSGSGFALKGYVGGKPWRLELGRPSRDYIHGQELRARAELGIDEDAAVLLMNRPLKDALEKKAYATYTDGLQTIAAMGLPEEIRWLSLYQEVGWDSLPREFWARYAVLADRRENALAWIDPPLAQQLMAWPQPAPGPEVPFMLLLLRGKAYLRMQYDSASMSTFQHATAVFTGACEAAIGGLPAGRPR